MADILRGPAEGPGEHPLFFAPEGDGRYRRFFLARRGLRSLRGRGDPFLGYAAEELFWRDLLELTHDEDLPGLRALISLLVSHPGGVGTLRLRLRNAGGVWHPVEASFRNVLEGPDDVGLLFADLRDASDES